MIAFLIESANISGNFKNSNQHARSESLPVSKIEDSDSSKPGKVINNINYYKARGRLFGILPRVGRYATSWKDSLGRGGV